MQRRSINLKCLKCATEDNISIARDKECYKKQCSRTRWYYKDIEKGRAIQRRSHRYIKWRGDKCAICGATNDIESHHMHAQCKNGLDEEQNIMSLCHSCHMIITKYQRFIGEINNSNK